MSPEMARSIIDECGKTGIAKVLLFHIMGEPTLYPHLIDIVSYATERGVKTCLTTNGSRLDEKLLDQLISAGVGEIIISLQTPDEKTFALRGAQGLPFEEYAARIVACVRKLITETGKTKLTISFLSSPLRKLIIPIFPDVSIADTSSDLRRHLKAWAQRILIDTPLEHRYNDVVKQMRKIRSLKENTVQISDRISFHTRILGDWSIHFDTRNVNAYFGYCPGIQENFGILWNGDYTFCCTDYEGNTSTHNYSDTSIEKYLLSKPVQDVVNGFNRFRVLHPYCKQCLGDRTILNAAVKQIGSICYFKFLRNNGMN